MRYKIQEVLDSNSSCGIREAKDNSVQCAEFSKNGIPYWGETYPIQSPFAERLINKYLTRYVYPTLKPSTRIVLSFIVDRTINWGKSSEKIPMRHFLDGFGDHCFGTGLTINTIRTSIKELIQLGIVLKMDDYYRISFNNINTYLSNNNKGMKMLREPKKDTVKKDRPFCEKKGSNFDKEGSNFDKTRSNFDIERSNFDHYKEHEYKEHEYKEKELKKANIRSHSYENDLSKLIDLAKQNKIKNLDRLKSKKIYTASIIKKYWQSIIFDKHPKAIQTAWTAKDMGMVNNFIKATTFPEDGNLMDFIDFVLDKWEAVTEMHFGYMSDRLQESGKARVEVPEFPDITFVMIYKKNFLSAYQRYKFGELDADYIYRKQMRSQGYDDETIDKAIEQKLLESNNERSLSKKLEDGLKDLEYMKKDLSRGKIINNSNAESKILKPQPVKNMENKFDEDSMSDDEKTELRLVAKELSEKLEFDETMVYDLILIHGLSYVTGLIGS